MSKTPNKSVVRRCELMQDVAENVGLHMVKKYGTSEDEAADIGNHVSDFLATHWCGQTIYIPRDMRFILGDRDEQIGQAMERGGAHEIAAEHGISYVRVYQIYRRWLAEKRERRQSNTAKAQDISPPKSPSVQLHNLLSTRSIHE